MFLKSVAMFNNYKYKQKHPAFYHSFWSLCELILFCLPVCVLALLYYGPGVTSGSLLKEEVHTHRATPTSCLCVFAGECVCICPHVQFCGLVCA